VLPQIEHGNAVHDAFELPDVFPDLLCASRKRNTSPRVVWSVVRRGLVKRTKKLGEGGGDWCRVLRWRHERTLTSEPRDDGP
jgi:hypothetical protein